MKKRIMQKNFVEKLVELRKKVSVRFPSVDMQNLVKIIGRLGHYHYNKRKFILLGNERQLYAFLIENSYNPFTVYRWMLLERIPEDIKFQLKQNMISQKKASSNAFKRRHETDSSLAVSIKGMGLNLIRRM